MTPAAADSSSATSSAAAILGRLRQHSHELRELRGGSVAVLHAPVDPCAFLRQHVCTNTPALIKGAIDHWPAVRSWTIDYLRQAAGNTTVTAQLTPNGLGDAVTRYTTADGEQAECFCLPHSTRMPLSEFLDLFPGPGASSCSPAGVVPYLQVCCCSGGAEVLTATTPLPNTGEPSLRCRHLHAVACRPHNSNRTAT
jgi:hypothetical protein